MKDRKEMLHLREDAHELSHPLENFQKQVNSLFDNFFENFGLTENRTGMLHMDILENETSYTVHAEVPGMSEKDIEVQLEKGILSLKGEKRQIQENKEDRFHRVERVYGSFHRSIALPGEVNEEEVQAVCKDGVLTITLPKITRPASTRRIPITGN